MPPGKLPRLVASPIPIGVELVEELVAPLRLVDLADRGGGGTQPVERTQEPAVRRVTPPDIPGPAPTRLSQRVEAAVVADPEAGVRLDVVTRQLAEPGPRVEEAGPARHHLGHRVAAGVGLGCERGVESHERVRGLGRQHRLGRSLRADAQWLSGHAQHCTNRRAGTDPGEERRNGTGTIEPELATATMETA